MIRRMCLAALVLFPAAALADLPPPRDDYIGPRAATLGGLAFEHRVNHYYSQYRHRTDSYVLLVGCAGASKNCDLATREGVIDWKVVSADGKPIANGDLGALVEAFKAAHGHIEILFVHDNRGAGPTTKALSLWSGHD